MRIRITTRPSPAPSTFRRGTTSVRRVPRLRPAPWCRRSRRAGPHPRQARAFRELASHTVVFDGQADAVAVLDQADAALSCPRVTDDVRDGLAQAERQRALLVGVECDLRDVHAQCDASGIERGPRRRELLVEALAPVSVDGLPHFCQRVARDPFDVADLANRPAEVSVRDLGGELRLQDDDRERVARGDRAGRARSVRARQSSPGARPPRGP